ncbi:MAG: hypothetical protein JXX28_03070 [Deltaproteobacteria bacterium]|nr:hypothetical protein [Deltaproteobacteria bacterium]
MALLLGVAVAAAVPPPPPFHLDPDDIALLSEGGRISRSHKDGEAELGLSASLVRGDPAAVWREIADYDRYVAYLPYVTASQRIGEEERDGHPVILARLELTTRHLTTRYTLDHHQGPDFVWFELRSVSGSPVRAAEGWWTLTPWEPDPTRLLLAYQVRVETAWYVPAALKQRAADLGLNRFAGLVAQQVERGR